MVFIFFLRKYLFIERNVIGVGKHDEISTNWFIPQMTKMDKNGADLSQDTGAPYWSPKWVSEA